MTNFIEHFIQLSTQADADAIDSIPLMTADGPMTLDSVIFFIASVAGSPTAITLDVNITDGTVTNVPILAGALGAAAATKVLRPDQSALEAGTHDVPAENENASSPAFWRYNYDLNFTGGSTPTVTGTVLFRWRC